MDYTTDHTAQNTVSHNAMHWHELTGSNISLNLTSLSSFFSTFRMEFYHTAYDTVHTAYFLNSTAFQKVVWNTTALFAFIAFHCILFQQTIEIIVKIHKMHLSPTFVINAVLSST